MKTQTFPFALTGIGSLPFIDPQVAVDHAFRYDVPFLPQLPRRGADEMMIIQAMDKFPGLRPGSSQNYLFDWSQWEREKDQYEENLNVAILKGDYRSYLPSSRVLSCWQPFIKRLKSGTKSVAKIQLAGFFTVRNYFHSIRIGEVTASTQFEAQFEAQIEKTLFLRSTAMIIDLLEMGILPVLFLDEPCLAEMKQNPFHLVSLIKSLKALNIIVGIHCCGPFDGKEALQLPETDYLSFDFDLTLSSRELEKNWAYWLAYLERGGRLSIGLNILDHLSHLDQKGSSIDRLKPFIERIGAISNEFDFVDWYLTSSCGMAYLSCEEIEIIYLELRKIQDFLSKQF